MASYVGNKPLFGNFDKLDDISSSFNGSANTFAMTSNSRGVTAGDETQVVISLNGVIQEPVTDYFLATTGQVQFTTAPASGTAFFGYVTGNIGGTASTITDGIVTTAKLANTAGTGSAVQLAANTTALTVAANGNIGIGTTSPTSFANYTTVAINGTTGSIIDLEHGGTINSRVVGESPGLLLDGVGARYIKFHTNSLERMRITSAGNVGIGTVPTALFGSGTTVEIKGTAGAALRLARPSYATADLYADENGLTVRTQNNFAMIFATNSLERMRIDSSGNLLVGTTGHFNFSGDTTEITVGSAGTGTNHGGAVTFVSNNGGTTLGYVGFQENLGQIATMGSRPLTLGTNNTERMRIDSSGNLLVGTSTNPFTVSGANGNVFINGRTNSNSVAPLRVAKQGDTGNIIDILVGSTLVGSIDSASGSEDLIINSSDDLFLRANGQDALQLYQSGGSLQNITAYTHFLDNSNGSNDIGAAGARWRNLYLSGGVVFGTTGGTVSSKTLDDYEEGTFTYNFSVSSGSINVRAGYQSGYYTKIGRVVHIQLRFETTSQSSPSGDVYITGLPFASVGNPSSGNNSQNYPIHARNFSGVTNFGHGFVNFAINTTQIRFLYMNNNGSPVAITGSNIGSNFQGTVDITYITAA